MPFLMISLSINEWFRMAWKQFSFKNFYLLVRYRTTVESIIFLFCVCGYCSTGRERDLGIFLNQDFVFLFVFVTLPEPPRTKK